MTTLVTAWPTNSLRWGMGWSDQWTDNAHDWGVYACIGGVPAGWGMVSDCLRRDGGYGYPYYGNVLLVNTNLPVFAKPCTGYQVIKTPDHGRWAGRSVYRPVCSDPQYIAVGSVIWREQTGGPPPVGAYYCINKAFLRPETPIIHNDCSDGNCWGLGTVLDMVFHRSFSGYENINKEGMTFSIYGYDDLVGNCKGIKTNLGERSVSSPECFDVLGRLYPNAPDDLKLDTSSNPITFCDKNPGWCDSVKLKFCHDNPNHSWCDCINTEQRPMWKEIKDLLPPTLKGGQLACISPFCNGRNDVFKTSGMITQSLNCPDIKYIDQSVKVDGQGNITRVSQSGSIDGSKPTDGPAVTQEPPATQILGINSTLFYILLFLLIVITIVVSLVVDKDEKIQQSDPRRR